jgi:spermidine/putrescine transport system ATP-binding protein
VDGLDLQVAKGEFVSLLGPSGCGKSTILRLIAGLLVPSEGAVLIEGRDMTGVPANRRNLAMVFQNYALFPHMTVAQNVAFGLRVRGVPPAERAARVREALALVQLGEMEERYPRQLSGGQQQRVALARSLITRPSVLLLDEPLGALDRKLRQEMQVELKLLQQRVRVTTIFVTHDQEEALTLSDRVAVLHRGRLEQFGSPVEIYEAPRSAFVSDFVGLSNFFEGRIVGRAGQDLEVESAGGLKILARGDAGPRAEAVRLAVRPEKIRLGHEADAGARNTFPGRVRNAVYLGASTNYFVELVSGERVVVNVPNARPGSAAGRLAAGEGVVVAWDPESTLILGEAG